MQNYPGRPAHDNVSLPPKQNPGPSKLTNKGAKKKETPKQLIAMWKKIIRQSRVNLKPKKKYLKIRKPRA